ncbi:TIP-1 family-domain-containing protein [Baffinella frigidus]|nr:TIP-1 family-domain-containing protein [Cryptophyta sp. CCMP2293]
MAALEEVSVRFETLEAVRDRRAFAKQVQEDSILAPYVQGLTTVATRWVSKREVLVQQRRDEAWKRRNRSAGMAMNALGAVAHAASSDRTIEEQVDEEEVRLEVLCAVVASARYCIAALEEVAESPVLLSLQGGDADEEGVFQDSHVEFSALARQCQNAVARAISQDLADASADYRPQGRLWTEAVRDRAAIPLPEVSPAIIDAVGGLRASLHISRTHLPPAALAQVWRDAAGQIDASLFKHIQEGEKVSASGAAQLAEDMAAVTRQFAPFTRKPENFLKRVKEALRILTLPLAEAQGLWTRLKKPDPRAPSSLPSEEDLLSPIGVFLLTVEEARAIAAKRADLQS